MNVESVAARPRPYRSIKEASLVLSLVGPARSWATRLEAAAWMAGTVLLAALICLHYDWLMSTMITSGPAAVRTSTMAVAMAPFMLVLLLRFGTVLRWVKSAAHGAGVLVGNLHLFISVFLLFVLWLAPMCIGGTLYFLVFAHF